jgi:hypothetical protein
MTARGNENEIRGVRADMRSGRLFLGEWVAVTQIGPPEATFFSVISSHFHQDF